MEREQVNCGASSQALLPNCLASGRKNPPVPESPESLRLPGHHPAQDAQYGC